MSGLVTIDVNIVNILCQTIYTVIIYRHETNDIRTFGQLFLILFIIPTINEAAMCSYFS